MRNWREEWEPENRKCNGCGVVKPLDSDFYTRDKKARLGFNLKCKKCQSRMRWAKKHPGEKYRPRKAKFDDSVFEIRMKSFSQVKTPSIFTEISKLA